MTAELNPDCRAGKHQACRGDGWDPEVEQLADCPCDCHQLIADLGAAGIYVLRFEYSTKPLDANGSRGSHYAHARKVRDVKDHAAWLAKAARIPRLESAQVGLFWYVRTAGRRDADNLGPTYKAMVDGLVVAGVLVDDNDAIVRRHMPEIVPVDPKTYPAAWMELVIAPRDHTWNSNYRGGTVTDQEQAAQKRAEQQPTDQPPKGARPDAAPKQTRPAAAPEER